MLNKWLALQLLPTVKVGVISQPFEELLLHSFPFPFFLVSGDYNKLSGRKAKKSSSVRRGSTAWGKEDAIHNIMFVLGFNTFGAFSVFLPSLFTTVGKGKTGLGDRLREKVSSVLKKKNENSSSLLGFAAVNEMELVKSTVYEALRLNPPVPLQYGRARADFVLSSHESSFRVLKGELLCGYQSLAMKDPMVFKYRDLFVPERFMGDEGKELLHYLFWSNGPETELPLRIYNKQRAAKDYVVATVV